MNDDKTRAKMVGEMLMGGATKAPDVTIYTVTVVINQQTILRFIFSERSRALNAVNALAEPGAHVAAIVDDYGTEAWINVRAIVAVNLADMSKQSDGECEMAMVQALKQADLGRRARADSRLQGSPIMMPQPQRQN